MKQLTLVFADEEPEEVAVHLSEESQSKALAFMGEMIVEVVQNGKGDRDGITRRHDDGRQDRAASFEPEGRCLRATVVRATGETESGEPEATV
jgi:hypothetical protein